MLLPIPTHGDPRGEADRGEKGQKTGQRKEEEMEPGMKREDRKTERLRGRELEKELEIAEGRMETGMEVREK